MAKKYYWLKFKDDFFEEEDTILIEAMPNGKDYIIFFLKLQLKSIKTEGILKYKNTIPYTPDMLATITNTNIDIVKAAVKLFEELQLIEVWDDGTIYMQALQDLIGSQSDSTERVRKHREKKLSIDQPKRLQIPAKTNSERQRSHRSKKSCLEKQHIPYIEDYANNKRYGGNYYIVLQRDKYRCSICESIEKLCVHHIDGYYENKPLNNAENKMITLCRECHSNTHAGEKIQEDLLDAINYFSNESVTCNSTVTKSNTEIEKDIENTLSEHEQLFEELWKLYPRKEGKARIKKSKKLELFKIGLEEMTRAVERYKKAKKGKEYEYLLMGSTFFTTDYVGYLDKEHESNKPVEEDRYRSI